MTARFEPGGILDIFAATVRRQLAQLREMGMLGDGGGGAPSQSTCT